MDLTFQTKEGKFNYRVGAIIINNGNILLVKNPKSTYFYSVGGRVHFNETCEEAVRREVKEELGINMEIDRPVFFHEQFFDEKDTKEHFHEISIYYLMKMTENIEDIICDSFTENEIKEALVWLPMDSLDKYTVFPRFFATELSNLPVGMKSIVDIQSR